MYFIDEMCCSSDNFLFMLLMFVKSVLIVFFKNNFEQSILHNYTPNNGKKGFSLFSENYFPVAYDKHWTTVGWN